MHRFYVPDLPEQGSPASRCRRRGPHLLRVLRLASGDEFACSTGAGREHVARVEA